MGKEILGLISDSKFIVCVMAHSYNRSPGKVRSQIGTFWRGLSAIKVSISTCSETRVDALRTYGGKVNMWHTFGGLFCLLVALSTTSGSSTIRQCHAGRPALTST